MNYCLHVKVFVADENNIYTTQNKKSNFHSKYL